MREGLLKLMSENNLGRQKNMSLTRIISNTKKTANAAPNAKSKKAGCKIGTVFQTKILNNSDGN
jgi:hypothetical protein